MTKEYSPFTPGVPVPIEFFVGRAQELNQMIASAKRALETKSIERLFIFGERGIGKSSLSRFASRVVERDLRLLSLHVFLGGVSSLEEMVRRIFERLLQQNAEKPWFESIRRFLGNHVKHVGLFGLSLEFDASQTDLSRAASDFAPTLRNLLKELEQNWKGIFLILDDLNGLASNPAFANWLKSLVDEIATGDDPLPLTLVLIGLPKRRYQLIANQPSLDRVFDLIEIKRFQEQETREFYRQAFRKMNVQVTENAYNILWKFSGGFPVFMHEIGDAVFKTDRDNQIDEHDALAGILNAANIIGGKYIEPKVLQAIRSEKYKAILKKVTKKPFDHRFSRRAVIHGLSEIEAKVFDNFLQRMKKLDVIRSDKERGAGFYEFTSELYYLFLWMHASAQEQ